MHRADVGFLQSRSLTTKLWVGTSSTGHNVYQERYCYFLHFSLSLPHVKGSKNQSVSVVATLNFVSMF